MRPSLVALAAVTLFPLSAATAALAAQSHPLVGKWEVGLTAGQRVTDAGVTAVTAKATLVLALQGDSLIGTLTTQPIEGQPPRPPVRLAAKRIDGSVTFVTRSEGTMTAPGGESRTIEAISTWRLTAEGDLLSGSVARELVGVNIPDLGPQPLKGKRVP